MVVGCASFASLLDRAFVLKASVYFTQTRYPHSMINESQFSRKLLPESAIRT
jgi:hypothetical protein